MNVITDFKSITNKQPGIESQETKEECNSFDINGKNHNSVEAEQKVISISGTSNRYQIKKMIAPKENKRRVASNKWNLGKNELSHKFQFKIVKNIHVERDNELNSLIKMQIETKLGSYKQQDILKKRLDLEKFITFDEVVKLLNDSELLCDYCSCEIFILYELVRELKQWTLDRIDNDKGHNSGNVVIACLDCNIRRRRKNKDAFMFTKNLEIVRQGFMHVSKNAELKDTEL